MREGEAAAGQDMFSQFMLLMRYASQYRVFGHPVFDRLIHLFTVFFALNLAMRVFADDMPPVRLRSILLPLSLAGLSGVMSAAERGDNSFRLTDFYRGGAALFSGAAVGLVHGLGWSAYSR